jgi:PPE-repeat protein
MLAAAAAWESLAGELQTVASAYTAIVTSLMDGPWQGTSAAAMASASWPQISWLTNTAGLAQDTGARAVAAASAYEAAFAATVPPAEIAANRALLGVLLATNFLGQNTAAIAATEAMYGEMWAQDAAAMYGYSGATAQAAAVTPFSPAELGVNLNGLYSQFTATVNAATSAANAQGLYEVPRALMQMAGLTNDAPWLTDPLKALGLTGHTWNSTGDGIVVNGLLGDIVEGATGSSTVDSSLAFDVFNRWVSPARLMVTQFKDYVGLAESAFKGMAPAAKAGAEAAASALPSAAAAIPKAGLGGIAGAVGSAAKAGALSVPAAWTAGTGAANPVTVALNTAGAAAAAEPATSAFGGLPMATGAGAGRGVANFAAPRYGFKPTMVVQPPSGG